MLGASEQDEGERYGEEDEAEQGDQRDSASFPSRLVEEPDPDAEDKPPEHHQRAEHDGIGPGEPFGAGFVGDQIEDHAGEDPRAEHQRGDSDRPAVGPFEPLQAGQAQAALGGQLVLQPVGLAEVHQSGGEPHEDGDRAQQDRRPVDGAPDPGSRLPRERLRIGQIGARCDQPEHQREDEQAEGRAGVVVGEVEIGGRQGPRGHQAPVLTAGKGGAGGLDDAVVEVDGMCEQPRPGEPEHDRPAESAAEEEPGDFQGEGDAIAGCEADDTHAGHGSLDLPTEMPR